MITRVSIPVTGCYDDELVFFSLYFEGHRSPCKKDVLDVLKDTIDTYSDLPEAVVSFEMSKEAYEITQSVHDWQYVNDHSIVETNTFVEHPKWGRQPYSWRILDIHNLDRLTIRRLNKELGRED